MQCCYPRLCHGLCANISRMVDAPGMQSVNRIFRVQFSRGGHKQRAAEWQALLNVRNCAGSSRIPLRRASANLYDLREVEIGGSAWSGPHRVLKKLASIAKLAP